MESRGPRHPKRRRRVRRGWSKTAESGIPRTTFDAAIGITPLRTPPQQLAVIAGVSCRWVGAGVMKVGELTPREGRPDGGVPSRPDRAMIRRRTRGGMEEAAWVRLQVKETGGDRPAQNGMRCQRCGSTVHRGQGAGRMKPSVSVYAVVFHRKW
jgi:hypothetical protein